jgi:hypothetical protein
MIVMGLGISAIWVSKIANSQDKLGAQRLLLEAEYYLNSIFRQATNLKFAGNINLNNYSPGSSEGALRIFNGDSVAGGLAGTVHTIAVFNRETGASGRGAGARSQFVPTGLFYQMPTADTSGVLYIDLSDGTNSPVAPSARNIMIDRLVRFNVADVILGPGNEVLSVRFEIVVRYPLNDNYSPLGAWCPPLDLQNGMLGCQGAAHIDLIANLQVTLRDNLIVSDGTTNTTQSSQGRLYFYRILHPLANL